MNSFRVAILFVPAGALGLLFFLRADEPSRARKVVAEITAAVVEPPLDQAELLERPVAAPMSIPSSGKAHRQDSRISVDQSHEAPQDVMRAIAEAPNIMDLSKEFSLENLLSGLGEVFEVEDGDGSTPTRRWLGFKDSGGARTGRWVGWEGPNVVAVKFFSAGVPVPPYVTFYESGAIKSCSPTLDSTGFRSLNTFTWRPDGSLESVKVHAKGFETGRFIDVSRDGKPTQWVW